MDRKRLYIRALIVLMMLVPFSAEMAYSQHSIIEENNFDKAVELYNTANYIAAEKLFSDLISEGNPNAPEQFDYNYYRLMSLVKQAKKISETELSNYLGQVTNSPWNNQLWFELGKLQFQNKKYVQAARTFDKVEARDLDRKDVDEYKFCKGYSNFEAKIMNKAKQAFFEIKSGRSSYANSATYYWGYINYLEGNYETALTEFSRIKDDPQFMPVIPFYTCQIYYLQEKYDSVVEMAPRLLASAPESQKNDLNKIVGDSYFELGQYDQAVKYLEAYEGVKGKKTREDFYRVGYAYYKTQNFEKAVPAFEKASVGSDLLAQNAYYHLADSYLGIGDKNKAKYAFERASQYSFDPKIEEDALFNYAKITYELSYSPFNETIKAFDQYIAKYPDSERNDAAFDYLVKVYMTTRNYRDAISSIEKIKVQSPSVKEAYQRVTYYRGLEFFNDGKYSTAIDYFKKSLDNGGYNRTFKVLSQYWSAEAYYQTGKYQEAIKNYTTFQSSAGSFSLPEFGTAYYNTAYSYFKLKNYQEAASWFRKYINQNKTTDQQKSDAYNRLGDCYYIKREFDEATKSYTQSIALDAYDADYALFQRATCYGMDREFQKKVDDLNSILTKYPKSAFTDDALYEIGRTYERLENLDQAIASYDKLIETIPGSSYSRKSLLQLGLIYFNRSNYDESLACYKKVVEKYPNTDESKSALVGIKNNYVEMNNVDGYFAYTRTLGNESLISVNAQDSLFYMTAEKNYMSGESNAKAQFQEYLKRFPDGSFKTNATFYLGESLYASGKYSESLAYYEEVAKKNDNIFTEQSLIKAGELTFNAGRYDEALGYFERLDKIANTQWNKLRSRAGIMRCCEKLDQPEKTVQAAQVLLATEKITDMMAREAKHKLALANLKLGKTDEAKVLLVELAEDVKSIEGAEAKYLLAELDFNSQQYGPCETQIMDFIEKSTPHQYWLARAFILLSDVYKAKSDNFQAKLTLKSIVENYAEKTDGIIDTANEKLAEIEKIEQGQILKTEGEQEEIIDSVESDVEDNAVDNEE